MTSKGDFALKKTVKEIRDAYGMTRKQFCEYFGIPYRTVQDWELGHRKCPDYLIKLIEYKLHNEQTYIKDLVRKDMKGK